MSFFDDDEPTRVASGGRRPAQPRVPDAPGSTGTGPPDQRTARTRQLIAVGIGIAVLLVLALAIKGCADSRKERALKDYNRDVSTIITASNEEVSQPLFELLSSGDVSDSDLAVQVNQLRLNAEEGVKRAREMDVPDEMTSAHQNVMLALNLRAGRPDEDRVEARRRAGPRPGGRAGDRADRRPDAGVPRLRRGLVAARGTADRGGARRRRDRRADRREESVPTRIHLACPADGRQRDRRPGGRRGGRGGRAGPPWPRHHQHADRRCTSWNRRRPRRRSRPGRRQP